MGKKTSSVNGYEQHFAALESRIAQAERTIEFIRASRLGGELRAIELAQRQRKIDAEGDRALADRRQAAAGDRAKVFKRFAAERLAMHGDLAITRRNLLVAYNTWALENGVPKLHRFESGAEMQDAMETAFPKIEQADVPSPGYLGKHALQVPGYADIGLVPEGEDPAEVVERLNAEATREDAQRRAQHEDYRSAASVEDAIINTRRIRDEAARLTVEAAQQK